MSNSSAPERGPRERRYALLIDSTPELNQLLSGLFDQAAWEVLFARGNQDAVELARGRAFDLVITGERTTGQQDFELLRQLRVVRPHIRVIILTNQFVPGDVLKSIREHAFSYFSRPFATERIAEFIHFAMDEASWDDGLELVSATPNWVRLLVRCDALTAHRLVQFYREGSGLPSPETEEVASAFREILLNAIEHGAGFDAQKYVEVGYVRTQHMVLCKIKDPGAGFSLDDLKHAAVNNPEEDPFQHMEHREALGMRPGGFGILMSKKLVDDLIYNETGNEVLLIKYLKGSGTKQGEKKT